MKETELNILNISIYIAHNATCPTPPHAGKRGVRLGIYLIVEVMTLPLGPIYWVNPHI